MQLMPSSSGPAEIIFGGFNMAAITFSTYAFASEASRRRLYADIYDDLNESGYPDIKALRESYNKLWRRETLPPALFLSGGVVTTASFTGINFGILIGGANISRSAFITLGAVTLISITWTLLHAHFLFHPHTRSSLVTFTERSQLASNQTKHSGK